MSQERSSGTKAEEEARKTPREHSLMLWSDRQGWPSLRGLGTEFQAEATWEDCRCGGSGWRQLDVFQFNVLPCEKRQNWGWNMACGDSTGYDIGTWP